MKLRWPIVRSKKRTRGKSTEPKNPVKKASEKRIADALMHGTDAQQVKAALEYFGIKGDIPMTTKEEIFREEIRLQALANDEGFKAQVLQEKLMELYAEVIAIRRKH